MRIKDIAMTIGIGVMLATLLAAAFVPTPWLAIFDAVIAIILLAITCVKSEQ